MKKYLALLALLGIMTGCVETNTLVGPGTIGDNPAPPATTLLPSGAACGTDDSLCASGNCLLETGRCQ